MLEGGTEQRAEAACVDGSHRPELQIWLLTAGLSALEAPACWPGRSVCFSETLHPLAGALRPVRSLQARPRAEGSRNTQGALFGLVLLCSGVPCQLCLCLAVPLVGRNSKRDPRKQISVPVLGFRGLRMVVCF